MGRPFALEGQTSHVEERRDFTVGTAALHPVIRTLRESLKWGEAGCTPLKRGMGSSVRLGSRAGDGLALRFICHTGLVDRFREIYPRLEDGGNRAIVVGADTPAEPLRHCVTIALTCFLRKT